MTDPFTLVVPADATYRGLVPEVAGRYAELCGGSAADGAALAEALVGVIDRLADGAGAEVGIDLSFRAEPGSVRVDLRCDGREAVVRQKVGAST
jgi:hypothetical protein